MCVRTSQPRGARFNQTWCAPPRVPLTDGCTHIQPFVTTITIIIIINHQNLHHHWHHATGRHQRCRGARVLDKQRNQILKRVSCGNADLLEQAKEAVARYGGNARSMATWGPDNCFSQALDLLDGETCKHMSHDTRARFALTLAKCHLDVIGEAMADCPPSVPLKDCTADMSERAFMAFNDFTTHVDRCGSPNCDMQCALLDDWHARDGSLEGCLCYNRRSVPLRAFAPVFFPLMEVFSSSFICYCDLIIQTCCGITSGPTAEELTP